VPMHSANLRKLLGSAWYSNQKITDELGFEPQHDLRRALKAMGIEGEGTQSPVHKEGGELRERHP